MHNTDYHEGIRLLDARVLSIFSLCGSWGLISQNGLESRQMRWREYSHLLLALSRNFVHRTKSKLGRRRVHLRMFQQVDLAKLTLHLSGETQGSEQRIAS